MEKQILRMVVLGLSTAIGWTANAGAADNSSTIRYGVGDEQNINRLPQVIAQREGFFKREGVDLQIIVFEQAFRTKAKNSTAPAAPPPSLRDGMANGSVDMSKQQFPLLINDVVAGSNNIAVSAAVSDAVYFLVVKPEIKSFTDLKGKTVAVTNPTDGITLWTRKLLTTHGLKEGDVTLKNIAGSEGRTVCVKTGDCAGAILAQPQVFAATDTGFPALGITNEVGPQLYEMDIANPAWAVQHRDLVVKYIRATTAAMRFIEDPKNRDEVVKVIADYMKDTDKHAREMVDYIVDPKNRVLPKTPLIDLNTVKVVLALMGEEGALKGQIPPPERFVDVSYAKAAVQ